uniref:C-type lectin domain-containing protein n=1 Tax=Pundamilia nyererei TaxID=303518 RepID=A0A3B4H5R7_9CICH
MLKHFLSRLLAYFLSAAVTEQNKKNYMYISITKTWPSAREYCIKLSMDLAVIENSEENAEVSSLKPNNDAIWIGLYRVPWTWSDKSQSSLENWRSSKPENYLGNQYCVVENNLHKWDDDMCTIKYVFICHQECQHVFNCAKSLLCSAPILAPGFSKAFNV